NLRVRSCLTCDAEVADLEADASHCITGNLLGGKITTPSGRNNERKTGLCKLAQLRQRGRIPMARGKKGSSVDPAHMPHSDQFCLNRPSLWEAMLGMLAVGVLYAFLPTKLLIGPAWLFLAIEAVFLLPIVFTLLTERGLPYKTLHPLLLTLLGVLTFGLV